MPLCRRRRSMRIRFGLLSAIPLAAALVLAARPAAANARFHSGHQAGSSRAAHVNNEPFGHIPKGPLQIIISVDQQELHLYSDGTEVAHAPVATGLPNHPTPLGIFDIIQKSRFHRSNIYSDAPMPYMQRITWSGVALHEGVGVGHRASHGCIRMPHEFAARLWRLTRLGARVIIADPELRPQEFADPHLFVHEQPPAAPAPMPSTPTAAKLFMTAQTTVDGGKAGDATRGQTADMAAVRADGDPPAPTAEQAPPANVPGGTEIAATAPAAALQAMPPDQPAAIEHTPFKAPIAIFVSRKDQRIYVRQDFSPLFEAPVVIEHPKQRLGTHIFTALDYLSDGSTLRWNVVSMPGEQLQRAHRAQYEEQFRISARTRRQNNRIADAFVAAEPPETPQQALARIEIPPDVIERISLLIVPGSSLIISDQGRGEETGDGTDFIVVMR